MYKDQYFTFENDREELKSIMLDLSSALIKTEDIHDFGERILKIARNEKIDYEVRFYLNEIGQVMSKLHKYDSCIRFSLKAGLKWCTEHYAYNKEYISRYI